MPSSASPQPATFSLWPLPELAPGALAEEPQEPGEPSTAELAYERGFADGLKAAQDAEMHERQQALAAVESVVAALRSAQREFVQRTLDEVPLMALAIASKLVEREVAADATVVRGLVEQALAQLEHDGPLRVHLHPEDLAAVRGLGTLPAAEGHHEIEWVADPTMMRGGCLVEHSRYLVDGRLETALRSLYDALTVEEPTHG